MTAICIYDGDCGFCSRCVAWAARRSDVRFEPFQRTDLAAYGITEDAAATAVPWTKPADLLYDGTVENLPKLASPRGDQWAHVCFGDASVRRFKVTANPKLLWQLIGRNDGFNMDTAEVFGEK